MFLIHNSSSIALSKGATTVSYTSSLPTRPPTGRPTKVFKPLIFNLIEKYEIVLFYVTRSFSAAPKLEMPAFLYDQVIHSHFPSKTRTLQINPSHRRPLLLDFSLSLAAIRQGQPLFLPLSKGSIFITRSI
jgi:hypothetical protein